MAASSLAYLNCLKVMLRKCCQRPVLKIAMFTSLGMFIYIYCTHYLYGSRDVGFKEQFGLAYELIKLNGSFMSGSVLGLRNLNEEQKDKLVNELRSSLSRLSAHCQQQSMTKCRKTQYSESSNLLTLFTTFYHDDEKLFINNNTLFNWKSLPNVNLVVFTNSSKVQYYSELAKWHVMPVLHEATNAPILPTMFKTVMQKFDSQFYGYGNADLLFTEDLISTLETVVCNLDVRDPLLIVGRRTNVPASMLKQEGATNWENLKHIADKHGTLFQSDAEDYFIVTKYYPWTNFLPLAVGRRGYDNWMVTFSRQNNIPVIDVTGSVLCFHQTLESRGNFEGLRRGDYNLEILDGLNLPFSYAYWGRTICAGLRTSENLCGEIEIEARTVLDGACTNYYWSYGIRKSLGLV